MYRDPSRVSRGLLGFILGLTIASWLVGHIGPSPDVWGAFLP
jgi:hypothetical protein